MAFSIDPITGRLKQVPAPGNYTGVRRRQKSTGKVETLLRSIVVPATTVGKINIQFGGDSNFDGQGVAATRSTDAIMALARAGLDSTKYDVGNIYESPWQQGGRKWPGWLQMMHIDEFASYRNDPNVRNPSWIQYAYKPGLLNILVLMLGTNDVGQDTPSSPYLYGGTALDGTVYAGVEATMTRVINELRAIGWVVILLNPMAQPFYGDKSTYLHDLIASKGPQLGARVYDVSTDQYIGFNPKNGSIYWNDDLHLSKQGLQRLWAQIVRPAILANS